MTVQKAGQRDEAGPHLTDGDVAKFERDGFLFPVHIFDDTEINRLRTRFRNELLPLWRDPTKETDYTFQTHLLFPWLDKLVRHPTVLDAVECLLGPDLLLWNSGFVMKPAYDPYFASWHQDLTYWGLGPPEVVTAWLAFTDSTPDNGCVRFIPATHKQGVLPVTETHGDGNMLSRGQTIDVAKAEPQPVDAKLKAGEMSLHHVLAVHGSNPNRSDNERIGMTMTYVRPDVTCAKGRDTATLVRGRDTSGHFDLNPAPTADLDDAAIRIHAKAAQRRAAIINAPN